MHVKHLSLSILLFFFLFHIKGQDWSALDKKIPKSQLQEELAILKRNLEEVHIGLYEYYPKSKLDSTFKAIDEGLLPEMSPMQFYRVLTPLLQFIANGHTAIRPPEIYYQKRNAEDLMFPFAVHWQDGGLYVLRNLSQEESIRPGAQILSINGTAAPEIFKHLANQMTRDGYNQSLPETEAARAFTSFFAIYYGNPPRFDLKIKGITGEEEIYKLSALPLDSLRSIRKKRYGSPPKAWYQNGTNAYTLEVEGKTAIMTLRTFGKSWIRQNGLSYKKFFNTAFQEIEDKEIEHLIIDMRDNGGGDPEPTIKLFAHLHNEPFTFYEGIYTSTRKIPDKEHYKTNVSLLNFYLSLRTKKEGDIYRVKGVAGIKESKPALPYYQGKTYILTNANSFSATGEMTAILKEYKKGIFIGEEAGGNPNQNTSGVMMGMELPHSKIRVTMPLVLFKMNVNFENTGRGVIPDHIVVPSLEDRMEGRDVVMEFTKDLIAKDP
ncbi:MAG: S41 family peptidase [Bacteroidota bacterium]